MEILFNNEVIKLKKGFETLGIDYAAWDTTKAPPAYHLEGFKSFKNSVSI